MSDETMTLEEVRYAMRQTVAAQDYPTLGAVSEWADAIEAAIAERNVAEWGEPVAVDKTKVGLYRKFDVRRRDGSSAVGGKHHGCEYFVLDTNHDKHALPALAAYADSAECEFPLLSADLRSRYKLDAIADRKVAEWQPIETAPPFEELLDGSVPGYLYIFADGAAPECGYRHQVGNGRWLAAHGKNSGVTHWMPLPAAPKVTP